MEQWISNYKRKAYIIGEREPKSRLGGAYDLIADDGEYLAGHFSSSSSWARYDLGEDPIRINRLVKKFGNKKYEIVHLFYNTTPDEFPIFKELVELNNTRYKDAE